MLQQSAQPVPRLQMNAIVGLIPVVGLEVHGDCAVICHAQAVNQLLEIGTALLGMPILEPNGLGILMVIGTPDHDASSVVVNPLHLEVEAVHDRQHNARLQGGAIRGEQPVQRACEPVVAELALREEPRFEQLGPFLHRIERVAINQDVLDQSEERIGVARIPQRQRQLVLEPHALDEVVQNRERAHTQCA
jgi:hypothetical protein